MSLISIRIPEDLEQVLRPVLERDPDKGAEWLRAGFEARLLSCTGSGSLYASPQPVSPNSWASVRGNSRTCCVTVA